MGIQCGIVGLPNVGKSTLFNALTKAGIAAANFPFCTIEPNVGVVPVSAAIEEELSQLEDEDRDAFLADLGLDEPGLNRVIRAAYKLLGLQTYFTAGVKEVRAWTVKAGSTAPQAAAVIHTDFEKGFIRAETIGYEDFLQYRGEAGAREAGRLRLEGKEYRVQEGDVLHFRFNV